MSDREATLSIITGLGERAEEALSGQQVNALPSPTITDRNLAHFLSRAGQSCSAITDRGAPTGPRLASETYIDQANTNDAVVNCVHQLDHRTKTNRAQLDRVESMLSETMRRLDRLEATLDDPKAHSADRRRIST